MSPTTTRRPPSRPTASSPRRRTAPATPPRRRRLPVFLIGGVALAAGLAAVIVLTMGTSANDGPLEVGTPTVSGEALARFVSSSDDPAVGQPIPEVAGEDFDGTSVAITRDGRAKVLLFVSHWCSVCREEVPLIVEWLPGAAVPDNVEILAVSTGVDPNQVNYPPSEWLADERWTLPVIMDDEMGSVAAAFGLPAYPYFVFVDTEGRVALRHAGGLPAEALSSLVAGLAEG